MIGYIIIGFGQIEFLGFGLIGNGFCKLNKNFEIPVIYYFQLLAISQGASPEEVGLKYHKIMPNKFLEKLPQKKRPGGQLRGRPIQGKGGQWYNKYGEQLTDSVDIKDAEYTERYWAREENDERVRENMMEITTMAADHWVK